MSERKRREMNRGKRGGKRRLYRCTKQTCSATHRLTTPFVRSGSHISLAQGPFVGLSVILALASPLNVWTWRD